MNALKAAFVLAVLLFSGNSYAQQGDLQAYTHQLQQALEISDHLKVAEAIQGLRSLGVEDPRLDFFEGRAQYHQKHGREAARLIDAYLKASPKGEYAAEARELQGGMSKVLASEAYTVATEARTTLSQKTLPKFKEQALENLMDVAPYSAYASETLCNMYMQGYYVERDSAKARAYCESAYEYLREGDSIGLDRNIFIYKIAHMKRFGFGGDPQVAEAMSIYEDLVKKAEKDYLRTEALARIAEIYLYGQGNPDCESALSILSGTANTTLAGQRMGKFEGFLKARIVLEETCTLPSGLKWGTLDYAEAVLWKNDPLRAFVYAMVNDRQDSHKSYYGSSPSIMGTGDNALNQAYQIHTPQGRPNVYLKDIYSWDLPYPHEDHGAMIGQAALLIADEIEAGRLVSRKALADYLEMASLFGADVDERLASQQVKDEKLGTLNENIRQVATYAITSRVGLKKTHEFDYVKAATLDPSGDFAVRSVQKWKSGFLLQAINMNAGEVVRNYSKMQFNPKYITMTPKGDVFAISGDSNLVQFYSVNSEKPIHSVKRVEAWGKPAFGGSLGTVFVTNSSSPWALAGMSAGNRNLHWSVSHNGDIIQFLSFSPSGKRFAYKFDGGITVADSDNGRDIRTFKTRTINLNSAEFLSEDVVFTGYHEVLNVLDGSVAKKGLFTRKDTNGRTFSADQSIGLLLAGGGRWLITGYRGKVLILNPLSLEVVTEIEMDLGEDNHIEEIVTTGNPRFVLVRDKKGILHRLEWTGMAQATDVPTIARVLAGEKPAAVAAAPNGPFAPCEVDLNGLKVEINDEEYCKGIAMHATAIAPAPQASPQGMTTVEGGGMFGRRVTPGDRPVTNKKCLELGIDDLAECKKYLNKSLLGQKLYEARLNKLREQQN